MTITIQLSSEEEKRLSERAAENGHDVSSYIHLLIERDIQRPNEVDQALEPFRRQAEESGLTDDELGRFFEEVRDEVWQDKQLKQRRGGQWKGKVRISEDFDDLPDDIAAAFGMKTE